MIAITDETDRIKVWVVSKDAMGGSRREYLAGIKKRDLQVPQELIEGLGPDDVRALNETIEIYRQAAHLHQRTVALNLPATLQSVIDYVRSAATEAETRLIQQVIEQARRDLRKYENAPHADRPLTEEKSSPIIGAEAPN